MKKKYGEEYLDSPQLAPIREERKLDSNKKTHNVYNLANPYERTPKSDLNYSFTDGGEVGDSPPSPSVLFNS